MNEEIPIVEVYESEQTYEMVLAMYNQQQKDENINLNRPQSPIARVLIDVTGFILLNALTFLVTDILRGAVTGDRPGVWWFFYGPWYYMTSAPLINNIVTMHRLFEELKDRDHDVHATPEELAAHQERCHQDGLNADAKCCNKVNGTPHYTFGVGQHLEDVECKDKHGNVMDPYPQHSNAYSTCIGQSDNLESYCSSFNTDAAYERALQMQQQHPYLFDIFYLFNYGSLPPTADVPFWWPF